MIDACGRRFWRSSDGTRVATPTSRVGYVAHAYEQYCARGGAAKGGARGGCNVEERECATGSEYRAMRDIAPGERLVIRIRDDVDDGNGKSGARAVDVPEGEAGEDLFRWMRDTVAFELRATTDGNVGVFATDAVAKDTEIELSLKRAEEVMKSGMQFAETSHRKVSKAFQGKARALECVRRRFPFSEKYQTLPLLGALDRISTLGALRHADAPTLSRAAAASATFKATRDIVAGEELTINRGVDSVLEFPGTGGFQAFYEWTVKGASPPWERSGEGARERGGIDYSKWDDLFSSSDEDDELD